MGGDRPEVSGLDEHFQVFHPIEAMDEEAFIVEVQNNRIIYDPSHPFYMDNHKEDMAWNAIAGVMGVEVGLCKAKWQTLRDTFVKQRKKVLDSGSAGRTQKDWKYANIMSFLLPHLNPISSKSNLTSVLAEEERSSTPLSVSGSKEQASTSASVPQERQSVSPASGSTTSGERGGPHMSWSPRERGFRKDRRRSQRPQSSDVEERLLSILEKPVPKPNCDLDECYHFTMSLVPQLNRLDQTRRKQAKIGILNLLHNIETSSSTQQHQGSVKTPTPTVTTPTAPLPQPGAFRPVSPPPPLNTTGRFEELLAMDFEGGPYTGLPTT